MLGCCVPARLTVQGKAWAQGLCLVPLPRGAPEPSVLGTEPLLVIRGLSSIAPLGMNEFQDSLKK